MLPFRVDQDPVKVLLSHAYFNGVPRRLENCAWLENWRARSGRSLSPVADTISNGIFFRKEN
jgi:hypothetical protein